MRIGIISDVHDHIHHLRAVLAELTSAELLLCCGDLCSPFMVAELAGGFQGPVHVVFGNNDGDTYRITRLAAEHPRLRLQGEFAELPPEETGGIRIAMHHFPEVGRRLGETGRYDLVCYGHSHEYEVRDAGEVVLVNPGEVMGRYGKVTYAAFDTETRAVERGVVKGHPA